MRITITIDATEAEAAALVEQLHALFGDRAAVTVDEADATVTAVPVGIVAAEEADPAPGGPVSVPPPRPAGRGQLFQNPQLAGEPVAYGAQQSGPPAWIVRDFVGQSRPGGETQALRCALFSPGNSAPEIARYLNPIYASTALEMGGAFRTLSWEVVQAEVPVRAGFACELEAVFHPLVSTRTEGGLTVALGHDQAADWAAQLEWRWVVRDGAGQDLETDAWRDGATLGRDDFDPAPDRPHSYRWRWGATADGTLTFALQFRTTWALAETRVLLHQATCVER